MKKVTVLMLFIGFAVAVCHALPVHSGYDPPGVELSKKDFQLEVCDLPLPVEMPKAAPAVFVPVVKVGTVASGPVRAQSNSPPKKRTHRLAYSMAGWRA